MPTQTTDLFLLEDLENNEKTTQLGHGDLDALHAVADWIESYGRTFWLAPEHVADKDVPAVVELMDSYRRLFHETRPTDSDDAKYKVIVVVFTDLPADRAQGVFDGVLEQLAVPSPVPFLFVFPLWARRFGERGVHALADELRRLQWNKGDSHEHQH